MALSWLIRANAAGLVAALTAVSAKRRFAPFTCPRAPDINEMPDSPARAIRLRWRHRSRLAEWPTFARWIERVLSHERYRRQLNPGRSSAMTGRGTAKAWLRGVRQ